MAARVNLFFLFFLGCAFYFISSTDAQGLQVDTNLRLNSNIFMSLAEKAKLLAKKLSTQQIERDELACIVANYFGNKMPTKNVYVLSVPYTKKVIGSEKAHIEIEHEAGTLDLDIIVFDKGVITLKGLASGKNACYIGYPKYIDIGIYVFERRQ